jgi:DNA-binding transcriptional ArsR family regulator
MVDRTGAPGAGAGAGPGLTDDPTGRVFDALADPNRRYVVEALAERGTATATELASELNVSRQAVAKHFAALSDAGLVESRREGRETRYELTPQPLAGALDWMADVGGKWDARLRRLHDHLSGGSRSGGGGARRRG